MENFDNGQEIIFNTQWEWSVNVLIWPNWSWKSNFLLIINEILKAWLMKDYVYNPDIVRTWDFDNFTNVITFNEIKLSKISKHFRQNDKDSKILIWFNLNNNDIENIWYINKNKENFQKIIRQYSTSDIVFWDIDTQYLSQNRYLEIIFNIDIDNQKVSIDQSNLDQNQINIIEYIKNTEMINICSMIQKEFNYITEDIKLYPLKNTIWSIWLHRNFANLSTKIDPQSRNDYIANKNTIQYPPFIWYYLCINKVREIINSSKTVKDLTIQEIEKKLENSDFYSNLQYTIQKYFNKSLLVGKENEELFFYIVDSLWQIFKFEDLSDWEQSFLTIIFAIYWFDIKDWTIMIDEPEIHTHPQIQRSLIRLLQKVSITMWTQFIISTYSPLFINERNIPNVYKFSKINWETNIINPGAISTDEWSLIQMLKFENASKIFFSKKIIMVEWETDAYFFEFYLNYLHTFKERKTKITNYEIININWKWWFKRRKKFLSKFWIESYFIWDWDNTVEFDILKQLDLNYYYQQSKKHYNLIKKNKWYIDRHYTRLVNTIRDLYPQKHNYVINRIDDLYRENIFILKKWDIETYLWIKAKWLEETVNFCHRYFHQRLNNKKTAPHREELNTIISKIFS